MIYPNYPKALVWGRLGPDQQIDNLIKEIAGELPEMPPTLRANILAITRQAVEDWEPFAMTWYPIYDEERDV